MRRTHVLVTYFAFTLTLLFPLDAFPSHPYSEYDPKAAPWIGIALSGGGLRAAAFSHGVMLELRKLCLIKPREQSSASLDQDNLEDNVPLYSLHYFEDTEYSDDDHASPCGRGGGASFLDNVHFLSGVSGGAITAAYYKTHPDQLMEFGQKLRDTRLAWKLFTGEKTTPTWRPPLMLFSSMLDTMFQMFKLPLLPIPEIEVVPFTTMALYDGLFESEQLARVYSDLFLNKTTFGELEHPAKNSPALASALFGKGGKGKKGIGQANLLINATDIVNGRILTFDKETFACLGSIDDFRKLPLSVAVAASSSLPGVFSPLHLKSRVTGTDPRHIPTSCPLILGDQVRSPILVDGGVSDNLGVTGLLRAIFERKNKNEAQEDVSAIATGQMLEVDAQDITRPSLSSTEPQPFPTVQRKNPKAQKTFLLIVNAGVTATSSLPKLAGHLDKSFDVLIRDRTDLSRVVAQRLLGNFGFGVVELNMRDLVKSNRVVSRIVRLALANQRIPSFTDDSVRQVAQTFDFTEMERKVLDDLNRVGLLPTKDEIDTLILAGRAVVAEMSYSIKQEYGKLVDKEYFSSCDNIINPERHYCWHSSFETPHLAANKVGVMLDLLTRTSEDFLRKVSENGASQLAQIRFDLWNWYLDESRALDLLTINLTRSPLLVCRIEQDKHIHTALQMIKVEIRPCARREGKEFTPKEKDAFLKAAPDEWLPRDPAKENAEDDKYEEERNKYVSNLLDPETPLPNLQEQQYTHVYRWLNDAIEHMLLYEDTNPDGAAYYYFLARYLILQKKLDEGLYYLYKGLKKFPDNFNLPYLLGYYSIHLNRDFQGGLKHLASAVETAARLQVQIDKLPPEVLKEEHKAILKERFSRAQEYYTMQHARYTGLSPIPLQGQSELISDEEIDAWLNRTFPDGHGGNDISTLVKFAEESKPTSQSMVTGAVCRITRTLESMPHSDAVSPAISGFLKVYGGIKCPNSDGEDTDSALSLELVGIPKAAPCGDLPGEGPRLERTQISLRLNVCKHFAKIRHAIRELLAPETALIYARAQARRLYESASEKQLTEDYPYRWERADTYGMIVLLDAIQKKCPQRDEDLRTARRLFHVARASVGEDHRLESNDKFIKGIKKRIGQLENVVKELSCGRR